MEEKTFLDNWYYFLNKDKKHLSLSDDNNSFTREDVEILSGRIYSYLKKNNIGKEDVVMISLNRSAKVFVAALGILKAGAIYLIVDNSSASKRSDYIKENSKAKLVFDEELFTKIEKQEDYLKGYEKASDHDGAYIVYTSGSAGKPKGVLHERGNIDLSYSSIKHLYVTNKELNCFGVICPLQFVAASLVLNVCLNCGMSIYVADNNKIKNIPYLIKCLLKNKVSDLFLTPDLFKLIDKVLPRSVKTIYLGGAPCDDVYSKRRVIYNGYVSSESGYVMNVHILEKAESPTPIGHTNNGFLRIENGELIAKNLYTRGYIDKNLNEGVFVDGEYHTGDLGKEENGYLYVTGRANEMIKINGNRIEPHEVESVFKNIYGYQCVVKATNDNSLALFYVGQKDLNSKEVNKKLGEYLPPYAYISYIRKIKKFTFGETGKIDKKSLVVERNGKAEYVAPTTKLERKLVKAIERQLNIKNVGVLDDFFELGGDSLSIISIVSKLKLDNMDGRLFYEGRTVRGIVSLYEQMNVSDKSDMEIELEERKKLVPLEYPPLDFYYMWSLSHDNISVILSRNFVLGKIININRFRNILNKYIKKSSSYNARIVLDKDGNPCFKYAPELFKEIEVLKMSEDEAKKYMDDFTKPMDLLNELPYRFALIKTEKNKYFLMNIHHSIIDGEGIDLFIKDILKGYFGLPYGYNNFFSYLKENHDGLTSERSQHINEETEKRAKLKDWNYSLEEAGEEIKIIDTNMSTGIKLSELNSYLKKYGLSRGALFCSAMALAKANINKNPDVVTPFISSNRFGTKNHGGVRYKPGLMFLEMNKSDKYIDFIKKAKNEYDDAMSKATVYNSVIEVFADYAWLCNDLNDLYTVMAKYSFLIDELPMSNEYVQSDVPDRIKEIYFFDYDKELYISHHLDRGIVSERLQKEYTDLTLEALKRLIAEDETVISDFLSF